MAKLEKVEAKNVYTHPRGWGHEEWIENLHEYCGKVLVVEPGKRCSLHFHMNKLETMFVIQGQMNMRLVDPKSGDEYFQQLEEGDSIRIPRGQPHQIINDHPWKFLKIVEFSTHHEETDSYRVQKGD